MLAPKWHNTQIRPDLSAAYYICRAVADPRRNRQYEKATENVSFVLRTPTIISNGRRSFIGIKGTIDDDNPVACKACGSFKLFTIGEE
jgi:hypothetical protein